MKKTYMKPQSILFVATYDTETMEVSGTHSIDPYMEKGIYNIGGDEGDAEGIQPSATGSGARERLLWGEGKSSESLPSGSLW